VYGQLNAIAKEFNFPSTAGLCLYLHVNESGIVTTPRISDESWHMLWSHLFDLPSVPRSPPIGGRIEFDIDFQHARWYSSWLSTFSRDQAERPFSHAALSMAISSEPQDLVDGPFLHGQLPPPAQRHSHTPRKLSLVDRFDLPLNHQEDKIGSRRNLEPPDDIVFNTKTFSPIVHGEEPRSAREQLDNRVKSWRKSAVVKSSSLAGQGQICLEASDLEDNVSLDGDVTASTKTELNLDDFTWSISSAGPDDHGITSFESSSERLPSPDMARRILDDSLPTPSTATSWGPPLSYPPTPSSNHRPPSLDLAFLSIFSPAMSPVTATSWGPSSASSTFDFYQEGPRPRSIHLGERGEFSRPVTPSTATSCNAQLSYPPTLTTPFHHVQDSDPAQELRLSLKGRPWPFVWPYFEPVLTPVGNPQPESQPWHFVWPYFEDQKIEGSIDIIKSASTSRYPFLLICKLLPKNASITHLHHVDPPVYPYFNIYPPAYSLCLDSDSPLKVILETRDPSAQNCTHIFENTQYH